MDSNLFNLYYDFIKEMFNQLQEPIVGLDKNCKIRYWNQAAKRLTGYSFSPGPDTLCPGNILLQDAAGNLSPCQENCPAKDSLKDKQTRDLDAYLKHKEGYRIPVKMQVFPLPSRDHHSPGAVVSWHETSPRVVMPHKNSELLRMDLLDPLTQLGNRHYLEMHLISRLDEMKKYGLSLGVLLFGMDDLSILTEAYGREAGKKLKRVISLTLTRNIRFFEVVGRWDEDKFLMVLLNMDFNTLDLLANKLRLLVEQSTVMAGGKFIQTTASIGGTMARASDNLNSLIKRTEKHLAHSQMQGKNQVTLHIEE